jgi:hypothetical protein
MAPMSSLLERPNRPRRYRTEEIAEILQKHRVYTKEMGYNIQQSVERIAQEVNRPPSSVYALIKRFHPSVDAAKAFVESQALRLAMRVVRKANVQESIDILQRPNLGVLAPKEQGAGQLGQGFFLSVEADSCGAVKVGVGVAPTQPKRFEDLPQPLAIDTVAGEVRVGGYTSPSQGATPLDSGSHVEAIDSALYDEGARSAPEEYPKEAGPVNPLMVPGVPHPNQGTFNRTPTTRQLRDIENHKKRLSEARKLAARAKKRDIEV